jgi:hypothetical protein
MPRAAFEEGMEEKDAERAIIEVFWKRTGDCADDVKQAMLVLVGP